MTPDIKDLEVQSTLELSLSRQALLQTQTKLDKSEMNPSQKRSIGEAQSIEGQKGVKLPGPKRAKELKASENDDSSETTAESTTAPANASVPALSIPDSISKDLDRLVNKITPLIKENQDLQQGLDQKTKECDDLRASIEEEKEKANRDKQRALSNALNEKAKVELRLKRTEDDFKYAKKVIEYHKQFINRAKRICDAHSRKYNYTYDRARTDVYTFFHSKFPAWCSRWKLTEIPEPEKIMTRLIADGILNGSDFYKGAPEYLKFKLVMPGGFVSQAPLEAALSRTLCELYLSDPYFLLSDAKKTKSFRADALSITESFVCQARRNATTTWRIRAVDMLQKADVVDDFVKADAENFLKHFNYLINKNRTKETLDRLIRIFQDFARLALKLWKREGTIRVRYMRDFQEETFQSQSDVMEADSAAGNLGYRLNGRPIGLLSRPLIVEEQQEEEESGKKKELVLIKAVPGVSIMRMKDGKETTMTL